VSIRVVVTGLGAITPLGNNVPTVWRAMVEGRSGIGPITLFDASGLQTQFAGEVKDYDPKEYFGAREARRLDRFMQFALIATKEALEDAGLANTLRCVSGTGGGSDPERIGVIIGTAFGGLGTLLAEHENFLQRGPGRVSPFMVPMMLPDSAAGQVAINFGFRGPNMAVTAACATGNFAIGEAAAMIRRGVADVMVAGGSEAAIVNLAMAAFNNMGVLSTRNEEPERACRPFDASRDGFVASEGAAVLILESLEHAQARGARIYAEMAGYGASADAYHITAPLEDGRGAAQAMRAALKDAGVSATGVDYINAHGTGTVLNDASETLAIKTVLGEYAHRIPISSIKSMAGHLLGAAGALEALACIKAIEESIMPPTINYATPDPACDLDYVPNEARKAEIRTALSNSFGFGGHNACIILRRLESADASPP
jgi:3-oxoacyl-[acyl-carrier-protein] synthase II